MARGYFCGGGSGGVDCDDATALEADILEGKTAGISGKDEIVSGKMPERGDWSSTELAAGEFITIPGGHHSGKGTVTTKSLEKQTPGNLDENKMLLGTYGWSGGKRVDGRIYSQEGIILNPGTTAKTGEVSGKYMLGNITVPAIDIPAAYIKKGQRITFPDGSSVVGVFEGWVPVATDLYYNGQNVAKFEPNNINTSDYASFDNNQISFTGVIVPNFKSTITYDVRSYSKLIIEGNIVPYASSSKVTINPNNGQQEVSASFNGTQSQIVVDITVLTSLNSGWTLKFGEGSSSGKINKGSYIRRIRLE